MVVLRGSAFFCALATASPPRRPVNSSMSTQKETIAAVTEIVTPLCEARGVEFVGVQVLPYPGEPLVRVIIDRPRQDGLEGSAVDIDDCSFITQQLSDLLVDDGDVIGGEYRLEVTSPGVERPLFRIEDFVRFAGKEARVQTQRPVDGRRKFEGVILSAEGDFVRLEQDGKPVEVPFQDIVKANLVYRF